jgi:hypothetical protein
VFIANFIIFLTFLLRCVLSKRFQIQDNALQCKKLKYSREYTEADVEQAVQEMEDGLSARATSRKEVHP